MLPREECVARAPVSNTPSAALTLLNDPLVEAARALGQRVIQEGGMTDTKGFTGFSNGIIASPV